MWHGPSGNDGKQYEKETKRGCTTGMLVGSLESVLETTPQTGATWKLLLVTLPAEDTMAILQSNPTQATVFKL